MTISNFRQTLESTEPTRAPPEPKTDSIDWHWRSVSSPSTLHSMPAGRVQIGSKINLAQLVDSPDEAIWKIYWMAMLIIYYVIVNNVCNLPIGLLWWLQIEPIIQVGLMV